jgi:hypothetical protein
MARLPYVGAPTASYARWSVPLVQQWRLPSAVPEAAVAVLVGPSRRLSYPVQGHELGHDELAHGAFPPVVAMHQFRLRRRAGFIADLGSFSTG